MKPERVKRAAEQADEMIKSFQTPTGEVAEGESSTAPANEENVDSGPDLTASQESSEPPAEEPTQSEPPATPDQESDPIADLREQLRVAESRWKTADGMLRAQNQQIEQYRDLLADVQRHKPQEEDKPAEPEKPSYTESDVNAFGQDLVEYIHNVASQVAQRMVDPINQQLSELTGTVKQTSEVTHLTAQERFETKLDQLAPNWQKLDADEKFIEWLKENTAMQRVFAEGVKTLDHKAVADVFSTYEQLTGAQTANKTAKRTERQSELESQVAPEKTRQSTAPAAESSDQKIWALSEIQNAYSNRRIRGTREHAMSAEDFTALERELAAAQAEGRVNYQS